MLSASGSSEIQRIQRVAERIKQGAEDHCRDIARAGDLDRLCRFSLVIENSSVPVAGSTYDQVRISTGFSGLSKSDDELAFLLGHEVGHVILRHEPTINPEQRRKNELEADHLGLLLANRAGYDPKAATMLLERLGNSGLFEGTEPSLIQRAEMLRTRIAESRR